MVHSLDREPVADIGDFAALKASNPAWSLLTADNAPLILATLTRVFTSTGQRVVPETVVVEHLTDLIDEARQDDPDVYPRTPREYLNDWCSDRSDWLKKRYPPDSDEPVYDLTVAAERALTWTTGLMQTRAFVGTESRLLAIVNLLDQIVEGTQTDPEERVRVLEERKADLDRQIAQIRGGDIPLLEPSQLRDRYQLLASTARGLLADFREVEDNFRALDRETRERIAEWDGPRGALLDTVLGRHDAITETDQGATFRSFYDFLMSPSTLERFRQNLATVTALPDVAGVDDALPRVTRDWATAADAVQRTVARLSAQLRRFLEEQAYADNRRIAALVRRVEAAAIHVRDDQPGKDFIEIDVPRAALALTMDRTMYSAPVAQRFEEPEPAPEFGDEEIAALAELFVSQRIDPSKVRDTIRATLVDYGGPLTVGEALTLAPLTEGMAELITVLEVADQQNWWTVDEIDNATQTEDVEWTDPDTGQNRVSEIPRVVLNDPTVAEDVDNGW